MSSNDKTGDQLMASIQKAKATTGDNKEAAAAAAPQKKAPAKKAAKKVAKKVAKKAAAKKAPATKKAAAKKPSGQPKKPITQSFSAARRVWPD